MDLNSNYAPSSSLDQFDNYLQNKSSSSSSSSTSSSSSSSSNKTSSRKNFIYYKTVLPVSFGIAMLFIVFVYRIKGDRQCGSRSSTRTTTTSSSSTTTTRRRSTNERDQTTVSLTLNRSDLDSTNCRDEITSPYGLPAPPTYTEAIFNSYAVPVTPAVLLIRTDVNDEQSSPPPPYSIK